MFDRTRVRLDEPGSERCDARARWQQLQAAYLELAVYLSEHGCRSARPRPTNLLDDGRPRLW
jgi:hypothetical protein